MNRAQQHPPAPRFFQRISQRLVDLAQPKPGDRVLEIMTGMAPAALPTLATSEVLSTVRSLELAATSGAQVDHPPGTFDWVFCTAAIFLLPDLPAALHDWQRLLKPGGRIAISGYSGQAMQPLLQLLAVALRRYGLPPVGSSRPLVWQQTIELEQYSDLLRSAGFARLEVRGEQLGYYLADSAEWWEIVRHSGLSRPLAALAPDDRAQFQAEHLAEVAKLATAQGIWLNGRVIFALGQKQSPV